jgi:hypothetical protein
VKTASWFQVDREGLAKLVERRGKEFIAYELIQNAWDTQATTVNVVLESLPQTRTRARLMVEDDDQDGFKDLRHAFTLFAESEKKADPTKRGRFNLGEKLVLALCDEALIASTKGAVTFNSRGRQVRHANRRRAGSKFSAIVRMSPSEVDQVVASLKRLIPPATIKTIVNGEPLATRLPLASFGATLQTEVADQEGVLRRSARRAAVEVYEPLPGERASIYELGIPIVETGDKWHYNVMQKVPLNVDRDNVTPAYLQNLRMLVLNEMHSRIQKEDATAAWVRDASADPDATPVAIEVVMTHRFGEKRVIADPTDPEGTKLAMAQGYTVVPGGALSGGEWQNVKRDQVMLPAGQVTPSPKVLEGMGGKDDEVPLEKYSDGMKLVISYTQMVAQALLDTTISIRIVSRFTQRHAAWYSPGFLTFNLARLGRVWFEQGPREAVDELLIHEFGHHYSGDHLSEAYHDALCKLGARLARLALEKPALFVGHGRGA